MQDDNIFLTPDPTVEDDIVRYTPGLALDYSAEALRIFASYSQDAEYYNDNEQLDSSALRRTGTLEMSYQASARTRFGIEGSYFRTPTPGELNLGDGLIQLGRTPTTREALGAFVEYAFSPSLDGNFRYNVTRDETAIGVGGDTHEGRMDFEKALSARNTLLFGYTYREFRFNDTEEADSHTAMVGWEHRFSPQTTLRILAGPRYFGDEVQPNVETLLIHEFATGELRLSYTRSETLLAGSATRVESQVANLLFTKEFGDRFIFTFAPAWGEVENDNGNSADVRQVAAEGRFNFTDYFAISASWVGSRQNEDLFGLTGPFARDIQRDVALVALHLTWPLRGERE